MPLKTIYVCRHGYRMNWVVDAQAGTYHTAYPTPTGIPSDPALAAYGEEQAEQLAAKIATLEPFPDAFYSSPFYRCLQTIKPTFEKVIAAKGKDTKLKVDPGLGEFYGTARFEHPQAATAEILSSKHFEWVTGSTTIKPSLKGETLPGLHDRFAYALHRVIEDAERGGATAILICTHAAGMIAIGRALTGNLPEDPNTEDFRCGTCALSRFDRREKREALGPVKSWNAEQPDEVPEIDWRNGKGVQGGWDCTVNGDCTFLPNGEERTWRFTGDESFLDMHDNRSSISRDGSDVDENDKDDEPSKTTSGQRSKL